ncbi:dual specificity protein phosphatase 26-like [Latimeria chalumnae]|uniref:dual specificity protein phosphatase 26-like n=1 Tax=Latimeria chalumnae TaxID=7897 RepID=UPI0006D91265|nr:PREDICTED: dual specificity protein phosphatase 26-like isoform X1 [Latimeria chalumnae]|eukprot:XP_014353740.1 PREDICTED: dual specificity protein phosphatase 26-like isoform X1 [Latimeria chalumnae]
MTTQGSMSKLMVGLPTTETVSSATPSVTEVEAIIDGCRVASNHVTEVWPKLYLGDLIIAHDRKELARLGITHVLNSAHSAWCSKGDENFYGKDMHYYRIVAEDSVDFDLSVYFHPAADYIHSALNSPNGKVLVHCILGKSRSASLVLAYLMIYHHHSLDDALRRLLSYRAISPNRGFLKQLRDLDMELRYKVKMCKIV